MRPLRGRTLSALSPEKRAEAALKVRPSAVPSIKRPRKKAKMFDPRAKRGTTGERVTRKFVRLAVNYVPYFRIPR
jgi:hypothetical protein